MKSLVMGAIALVCGTGMVMAETTVQSCNRSVVFDAPPQRAISNLSLIHI